MSREFGVRTGREIGIGSGPETKQKTKTEIK